MHDQRGTMFLIVGLALALIGCGDDPLWEPTGAVLVETKSFASGLVQRVEIQPATPRQYEPVRIRSVVVNPTDDNIVAHCWGRGVWLHTDLEYGAPDATFLVDNSQDLAPGDSVVSGVVIEVHSPGGVYALGVEHVFEPPETLMVQLEIVDRHTFVPN